MLLKLFSVLVGLVVLAFVLIVVAIFFLFDPNDYRGVVADLVQEQTGRLLEIQGDLSLDVVPCCGVAVEGARLSNREGFAGDEFLRVGSVRVGLRIWPLILRRQIEVGDVEIAGLELALVRREDGSANWEFDIPAQAETVEREVRPDEVSSVALPALTVAGLKVRDADIAFRDATTGADYRIQDLDLTARGIRIRQLIDIDTSFRITDVAAGTTVQASVTTKATIDPDAMSVTLANVDANIGVAGLDLPVERLAVSVKSDEIGINYDQATGRVEKLVAALDVAGIDLSFTADGSFSADSSDLSGTLDIAPFSPRDAMAELNRPPVVTSDPTALSSLRGTSQWSITGDLLKLDGLHLRLDQTNFRGQASVNTRSRSGLRFGFMVDDIDLSRYLSPTVEESAAATAQSGAEPAPELPVEMLRSLDLEGRARIDRLLVSGLVLRNLDVGIRASDGVIRVDPALAELYDGRYNGTITLDVTGAKPSAIVNQSLAAVQAGDLLADFADSQNVEGILEARIKAAGAGLSRDEIIRSLAGDVSIDLTDGVYKGVDLWHEIRKARARLKGEPVPEQIGEPETPITTLAYSGRMDNGVLTSERMVAEVPFIRLSGNGFANLVEQNVNYRFKAKVHEKPVFEDGQDLANLQNLTIPLTVTGDMASPSVGVDLAEFVKQEAVRKAQDMLIRSLGLEKAEAQPDGDATEQAGDQATEQPQEEDARDKLRKGLRDLLNR
jgi:AsmA protein